MADREPPHGYDEKGRPIWAKGAHGRPVCGHKRKNGSLCQSEARFPNGRCKVGGGKAGRPLAERPSPETLARRGRTKFYQSLGILEKVTAALEDPEIASHKQNIALIEGMLLQIAESEVAPPAEIWNEAKKLYDSAVKGGNASALVELGVVLDRGTESSLREEKILDLLDHQRKHKDSELKREMHLQTNLTARQMMFAVAQFLAIIREEVPDPNVQRAIALRFAQIIRQ